MLFFSNNKKISILFNIRYIEFKKKNIHASIIMKLKIHRL